MTIKTEITVIFHYPDECKAEIAFSHEHDMSEWTQSIKDGTVSYTKTFETEVDFMGKAGVDGYCHGKRKYDTGFCDEAIRRT